MLRADVQQLLYFENIACARVGANVDERRDHAAERLGQRAQALDEDLAALLCAEEDERNAEREEAHVRIGELRLGSLHEHLKHLHCDGMIAGADHDETEREAGGAFNLAGHERASIGKNLQTRNTAVSHALNSPSLARK